MILLTVNQQLVTMPTKKKYKKDQESIMEIFPKMKKLKQEIVLTKEVMSGVNRERSKNM